MSNNTNNVNKKITIIIVLIGLFTAFFLVYDFPQQPDNPLTISSYPTYYYQPPIPQEDQRTICIVFDDGWLTQYTEALPILDEYGFKASFAIITDNPNKRPTYMNWNQIITLYNQGHDIGSHTVNHLNLTQLDPTDIKYQLSQSKQDLLNHGINAHLFVYPFGEGAENPDIKTLVQQHYNIACSTNPGNFDMNQPFNQYAIPRYTAGNSLEQFKSYVDQANNSTIVIIYYPQIGNDSIPTSVTSENFAAQMQYLYDNNFTVQPLTHLFI